jgi:hypothetical protein
MKTTPNRFELAVFDPEQDLAISCDEYLKQRESGTLTWLPSLDDSTIFLAVDGEARLEDEWNLGDLRLIVEQLKDVRERLERGEIAILRSAVLDQPQAPYFLFEPDTGSADDTVRISQFFIPEFRIGTLFPLKYWSDSDPDELFKYVVENRQKLVESEMSQRFSKSRLTDLPFPRAELLSALPEEISLGKKVIELVEPENR